MEEGKGREGERERKGDEKEVWKESRKGAKGKKEGGTEGAPKDHLVCHSFILFIHSKCSPFTRVHMDH
jgi:hypothetical protein